VKWGNTIYPYTISVDDNLPQDLIKAMKGELEARRYYEQLIGLAPEEDKKIIAKIMNDERKHFNNFRKLYIQLTGREPVIPPLTPPRIPNYVEGIKGAIMDETDAYEFYRDIYLSTGSPQVRSIFFEAFTDENEHAVRLNYLYTKNKS